MTLIPVAEPPSTAHVAHRLLDLTATVHGTCHGFSFREYWQGSLLGWSEPWFCFCCFLFLEAFPGLGPEVVGHLLPAVGCGAEGVGGVVVEVMGGFVFILGVEVLPGALYHGQFAEAFLEEVVASGFQGLAIDAPTQ